MELYSRIESQISEFRLQDCYIPEPRRTILRSIASAICELRQEDGAVNLLFICTHNSRRSLMAQIWAEAAAVRFGLADVRSYSGGTEVSAFHPNAVKTVQAAGFPLEKLNNDSNPEYRLHCREQGRSLILFSKLYDHPANPRNGFVALMTCSDADAGCPVIPGAAVRFPLHYDDSKSYDNDPNPLPGYQACFESIGREILALFAMI